jgi:hypothetical protein
LPAPTKPIAYLLCRAIPMLVILSGAKNLPQAD